ncbi:GNAT family acetyltransferase [Litoreibacter ponti]|uniref:GNAT family acetyltransferase n=1 Tax=Litoreibacter ponti TaxID=1510457 RepID=A0A2T6BDM6_9RHOB|nr:GNAT family N-acetyltransferase [Litoreibacter ponti]PTX54175.1 GNAT family acetyltransferase [Litoreibacter ponti]
MIRWLGAEDLAAWRDIRAEGLRLCPSAFLTTLDEFLAESDASVAAKLAKGQVLGGFVDGALMAVVAYGRKSGKDLTSHRAELGAVYVRPAARGLGLAARLMQQLEAHAIFEGVTQLELYVEGQNAVAIRFYEKLGYVQYGKLPNAVMRDGVGVDDLFMVRALGR